MTSKKGLRFHQIAEHELMTIYEELESMWRREFHSPDLQPLRQGFFKDLSSYVRRLREAQQNLDAKSFKARVLEDEFLRLDALLGQLLDRRLRKLWSHIKTDRSSDLESVEREADQVRGDLLKRFEKMTEYIMQGREPTLRESRKGGFVLVRFEKDVPSIIGVDLKTRGPFIREDIAQLPEENADSLIRQGAAVDIPVSGQDNE